MNKPNILGIARQQLSGAISNFQTPPCDPLNVSPWIAMSFLQKAIRRGRKDLAFRAAATLLIGAPDKLWRRLGCIAFEDIGVGDLDTVTLVTAAMAGKAARH
jgi:replication-associated recombination protein RarA